ncbi:hypothetical protein Bpfe_025745, partial [Biomphalaria pfeifferi]
MSQLGNNTTESSERPVESDDRQYDIDLSLSGKVVQETDLINMMDIELNSVHHASTSTGDTSASVMGNN